MKAKINGIEVEGTPQEVAELAKLLEVRVELKPHVATESYVAPGSAQAD